jgi:hypothetical protein
MANNILTLNNPSLKTLDVTTATGIGYKYITDTKATLHLGLSHIVITLLVENTSTPAAVSLQLVRGGTTYTLATASIPTGSTAGQKIKFTPSTSIALPDGITYNLTNNPFIALNAGDTIQTNVTTAGLGGTPAGSYEVNIVIEDSGLV